MVVVVASAARVVDAPRGEVRGHGPDQDGPLEVVEQALLGRGGPPYRMATMTSPIAIIDQVLDPVVGDW